MTEALVQLMVGIAHRIDVIDIDLHSDLVALYDERVPVLFARRENESAAPGRQLCHYFLDVEQVKVFCEQ